jgi:hypothetical protein
MDLKDELAGRVGCAVECESGGKNSVAGWEVVYARRERQPSKVSGSQCGG